MHELDRDLEPSQALTEDAGSRDGTSQRSLEDDGQSLWCFLWGGGVEALHFIL